MFNPPPAFTHQSISQVHIHQLGRATEGTGLSPDVRLALPLEPSTCRVLNKQVLPGLLSAQHVPMFSAAAWVSHVPGSGELSSMEMYLLVMVSLGGKRKSPRRQMSMLESKL